MSDRNDLEQATLDEIVKQLKQVQSKARRAPWIGLVAFGGSLTAVSVPYLLDIGAAIMAITGLVLAVVGVLLYLEPWKKP